MIRSGVCLYHSTILECCNYTNGFYCYIVGPLGSSKIPLNTLISVGMAGSPKKAIFHADGCIVLYLMYFLSFPFVDHPH